MKIPNRRLKGTAEKGLSSHKRSDNPDLPEVCPQPNRKLGFSPRNSLRAFVIVLIFTMDGKKTLGETVEDMITMDSLTEEALLRNIEARYKQDNIYVFFSALDN